MASAPLLRAELGKHRQRMCLEAELVAEAVNIACEAIAEARRACFDKSCKRTSRSPLFSG